MSLTEGQLRFRMSGIGASESAVLLGLIPRQWGTVVDLWAEKRGLVPPKPENPRMRFGTLMEPVIAQTFAMETGATVLTVAEWVDHETFPRDRFTSSTIDNARTLGTLRHPKAGPVLATLDRVAIFGNEPYVLELKTADARNADKWGETGTDNIPEHYLCQVQQQLEVTGLKTGFLAVYIGSEFRWYRIEHDPVFCSVLIDRIQTFWRDYVLTGEPPPHEPSDDGWGKVLASRFPVGDKGKAIEIADDDPLIVEYREAVARKNEAELALEGVRNKIKERIGDGYRLTGAWGSATWQNQKGRAVTDWNAVVMEAGIPAEIIAKHTIVGEPTRRLVVKLNSDEETL